MSQFRHQLLGIIEPQGPICKLLQVISYQLKLANATVTIGKTIVSHHNMTKRIGSYQQASGCCVQSTFSVLRWR